MADAHLTQREPFLANTRLTKSAMRKRMAEIEVTLFTLFQEILGELTGSRITTARLEVMFKILHDAIALLIGAFAVVNTALAYTDTDPVIRQVFLTINMVIVSGLLGNFGARQNAKKNEKQNIDLVMQSVTTTRAKMGLLSAPPSMIVDSDFAGAIAVPIIPALDPLSVRVGNVMVSDLVARPELRARLLNLQSLIEQRYRIV